VFAVALHARTAVLEARFAAVLAERTRLAREIHDTLLQGFTGVALALRAATRRTGSPALDDVQALAQHALAEARQAVWDLRAAGEGASLAEELERVARQTIAGSELRLNVHVAGRAYPLSGETESVLLRVCQEALANTIKHARAANAWVELGFERRAVRLTVRDDGAGFVVDPSHRSYAGHWGLLGMRERADQLDAEIDVISTPGKGTVVALRIPRTGRTRTPTMRKGAPE
jgi:signal transduction histidine kinase